MAIGKMEIIPNSIGEKALYNAFKDIFKDDNATLRQSPKIRALINEHATEKDIETLLALHGFNAVSCSVRTLLREEIFQFEEKAEERFKGVTMPSSAPVVQFCSTKLPVRLNAPASESSEHKKITETSSKSHVTASVESAPVGSGEAPTQLVETTNQSQLAQTINIEDKATIPGTTSAEVEPELSTSMSNLPYEAQYCLLADAQRFLEQACFEFALKHREKILKHNNWACPEAIELDVFVKKLSVSLQEAALATKPNKLLAPKLAGLMKELRNIAVHRHSLSAHDMDKELQDAEEFLTFLGDAARLKRMTSIRRNTRELLVQLDRDERAADAALAAKREEAEAQRRAIQRWEDDAEAGVELTRGKFRGKAATSIIRAVGHTPARAKVIKKSQKTLETSWIAALVLWNATWGFLRLFVSGGAVLFTLASTHVV